MKPDTGDKISNISSDSSVNDGYNLNSKIFVVGQTEIDNEPCINGGSLNIIDHSQTNGKYVENVNKCCPAYEKNDIENENEHLKKHWEVDNSHQNNCSCYSEFKKVQMKDLEDYQDHEHLKKAVVADGKTLVETEIPDEKSKTGKHHSPKETWARHMEFMLSCIGYAVGFGAFWRFPYLCMRNGGGAFLIPYFLCLIFCGMPLFFLEMVIGQFSGLGAIGVWNVCPLFKGVGWAMLVMSGLVTIYSNMILGWVLYFLGLSFTSSLPWATCNQTWNTPLCVEWNSSGKDPNVTATFRNTSATFSNVSALQARHGVTPAEEFWHNSVLKISGGIEHFGEFRWPLVCCLFAAWVVVFLCLFKGIKWSGKVVYVTATVPYIFLTILLIRGCMLPGALDGIIFYLKPDFKKLMDPKVWAEACLQIFYSLGPTWGGLIAMSRYNKFNNNCLKDSVVICLVCCGTSFYSGFICFSIIGFMAHNIGTNVSDVITTGPGLVFNVYPEAIAQLPISPFWSICFFIMLLTLGLDSLFGMIESCTNGVVDEFPKFLKPRKTRLTLIVCVMFFLLGIPLCSGAGIYIFQILDWYAAAFTAMIIAILECIVLGHIYGANKLYDHITEMMNRRPSLWWKICWCYITPLIMLALLIYSCVQMKPPTYGSYVYPSWSVALGWIVSMFSIVPIPIYAIYRLSAEEGSLMERVKHLIRPHVSFYNGKNNPDAELIHHF